MTERNDDSPNARENGLGRELQTGAREGVIVTIVIQGVKTSRVLAGEVRFPVKGSTVIRGVNLDVTASLSERTIMFRVLFAFHDILAGRSINPAAPASG